MDPSLLTQQGGRAVRTLWKVALLSMSTLTVVACSDGPTSGAPSPRTPSLDVEPADVTGVCFGRTVTISTVPGVPTNGTTGDDVIEGTDGDDVINGMGGNDFICGRDGNDLIRGGTAIDGIDGGAGNDLIECGQGDDLCEGGPGDDTVRGNMGNDTVRGNLGNDRVDGGPGADVCTDPDGGTFRECETTGG
jgi:hypothetical protein